MDKYILGSLVFTSLAVFGLPGFLLYTFHKMRMPGVREAFKVCLLIWVIWIGFIAFIFTAGQERKHAIPPTRAEAITFIVLNEGGGFGGKRAQNRKNRKSKKLQRKNGIGMVELERRET